MNKILINNNILNNYKDNNIEIKDNKISFLSNGDYTLEYINSSNINLNIELKDNITIKLFIISSDNNIKINNNYNLNSNSNLIIYKFYYNKSISEEVFFNLNGTNSMLSYNFSSISKESEEYHIIVKHNNNSVTSRVSNKLIGLNKSRINMQIDSILDKGNINCIMEQNSRILTLGDVDATIIPNMFIEEDSVEARHGSVVGRIKPEDIFYLESRGITYEEAVSLIIKGLIFSNLVLDMEKRAMIFKIIQELKP